MKVFAPLNVDCVLTAILECAMANHFVLLCYSIVLIWTTCVQQMHINNNKRASRHKIANKNYCIAQARKVHCDNINCYILAFSDTLLWIKRPTINQYPQK